jgi:antitoxin VapB
MNMHKTAKLFIKGRSQAVQLPAAYQFEGKEVFIRKDPITGDVILSRKPAGLQAFFTVLKGGEGASYFLDEKERDQAAQDRDPFEGWKE